MDEKKRQAKLILVVGTNGTGKTTLIHKLVNAELKGGRKALIITPHESEWLTFNNLPVNDCSNISNIRGVERIHFSGDIKILNKINSLFFNGMLVLDDCRSMIKPNIEQSVKDLLISRRQMMRDMILVCHSIVDVPQQVFYYSPEIILKKTSCSFEKRKSLLLPQDYNNLVKAQERINNHSNPYYYELITTG